MYLKLYLRGRDEVDEIRQARMEATRRCNSKWHKCNKQQAEIAAKQSAALKDAADPGAQQVLEQVAGELEEEVAGEA